MFGRKTSPYEIDMLGAKGDPRYDPKSMRVVLPPDEIESLPIRYVEKEELIEAECRWRYNPVVYYRDDVSTYPNERGHDDRARYVIINPTALGIVTIGQSDMARLGCRESFVALVPGASGDDIPAGAIGRDDSSWYVVA